MQIDEELQKDLYAGGNPEMQYGDTPGTGLEVQDQEAPERKPWDFSGRKSPGMFDLKYGSKEELDLDWMYSPGAMKLSHVRQYVNKQNELNTQFHADVVLNPDEQPVIEGMHKPTEDEFFSASEQNRTKIRREYYRQNSAAVEHVQSVMNDIKTTVWDNGAKVLAQAGVEGFKDLFKKTEQEYELKAAHSDTSTKASHTDTEVIPNDQVPKHAKYGQAAVKTVEKQEGELTPEQKRVVEEEGYVDRYYYDTSKNVTYGVGQTGKYINMSFKETFKEHEDELKGIIPSYEDQPTKVRAELMQAMYRGDIQDSPKFVKLFNAGEYKAAANEFLDHTEYKKYKKEGINKGIQKRIEAVARVVRNI